MVRGNHRADSGDTAILASCDTSPGRRAITNLARAIGRAEDTAAASYAVFVIMSETANGGITWDHSDGRLDSDA
ncbi:hypothetical protein [Nonomuraea sp. SYSU D8015]|uniref:hypothetical protein n=1 Tax=Nonomuraea sp. SYSU D8015 TaxID=2593644 RepID=UPI00166138AA|nr:hypothetical protein [Nonomuraea sp. SYSU D8015]